MIESKKALSPEEVLMVAHGCMTFGIAQHHIAGMYGVDSGRVAEAVVAMRWAMENHRLIYKHVQKLKGNGRHKPSTEQDDVLRLSMGLENREIR